MKKFFLSAAVVLSIALSGYISVVYGGAMNEVYDVYILYNDIKSEALKLEFDDSLTVTGIVTETGISIYATPYVSLSNEKDGTVYATCVLPRTDALKLKEFKKGDKVTIQGNYYAFHDKAVIKKCKKV